MEGCFSHWKSGVSVVPKKLVLGSLLSCDCSFTGEMQVGDVAQGYTAGYEKLGRV